MSSLDKKHDIEAPFVEMQYMGGRREPDNFEAPTGELKKERLSKESEYLRKTFSLMGVMMALNLGVILYMIFTKRDGFNTADPKTYTAFEKTIISSTWCGVWGAGLLLSWGLLIFRFGKQPLALVKGVNYALLTVLVLSANGLLMYAGQTYDPMLLLVPGILCVGLTIFMYFFAQKLMDATFRKQRSQTVGELENVGKSGSYTILATIFLLSVMLIFFIYGFKGMAWIAITLVVIEVLLLLIDTSQMTQKFNRNMA